MPPSQAPNSAGNQGDGTNTASSDSARAEVGDRRLPSRPTSGANHGEAFAGVHDVELLDGRSGMDM